jgi:hypothetical protein
MGPRVGLAVLLIGGMCALSLGGEPDGDVLELGDVRFPHAFHYDALELECASCHHETQAAELDIPHLQYFEDFWINCAICHRQRPTAVGPVACSECHHGSPADIADETLSAKVVIHRSCWTCHEVGTGAEASRSCGNCHARAVPAEVSR